MIKKIKFILLVKRSRIIMYTKIMIGHSDLALYKYKYFKEYLDLQYFLLAFVFWPFHFFFRKSFYVLSKYIDI
jgi:hypothetical protein